MRLQIHFVCGWHDFFQYRTFFPDQLRQMIDHVLRKYGHKPKYRKVKYYGPSDYKPIKATLSQKRHTHKFILILWKNV